MAEPNTKSGKVSMWTTAVATMVLTLIGSGTGIAAGLLLASSTTTGTGGASQTAVGGGTAAGDVGAPQRARATGDETNTVSAREPADDSDVIAAFEVPPPVDLDVPLRVVPLEPVITNLSAPRGVWVRIEASLLVSEEEATSPETTATQVAAAMLTYLHTLSLGDIEGASGFLAFRDDLDDLARSVTHGAANRMLIKSLVVE